MIERQKSAHIWARDPNDWYVEPFECSLALFDSEAFDGVIWDPAAGVGRIVKSANTLGLEACGSDVESKSGSVSTGRDFFSSDDRFAFDHIVCNPPFKSSEQFVLRALGMVRNGSKVAMLLPLVWMAGFSSKRGWLPNSPLRRVYAISPRPSMPPGSVIKAGEKPGNGTKDFAWFVWEAGYEGQTELSFLNTKPYKRHGLRDDFNGGSTQCELQLVGSP